MGRRSTVSTGVGDLGVPLSALAGRRSRGTGDQPLMQRAYETIKAQILTFQLQPGSLVAAQDLADELGMSVTPVHQALKRLVGDRLCQVIPRTGYVITPVTLTDVQEIFGLRLALEPLAVDLGVRRATDRDLEAFQREVYKPIPSTPAGRGRRREPTYAERLNIMGQYHDDFHLTVARLSGHGRLVDMIRDLLEQGRRLTLISAAALPRPEDAESVTSGPTGAHLTITEAVLARDREAAVAAVADHTRAGHRRVVAFLSSLPVDGLAAGGSPMVLE